MPRIFQSIDLAVGTTIELDQPAAHHLLSVLRVRLHEKVIVFNGRGGEYQGTITSLAKKKVLITLERYLEREAESPLNCCLAQAISRGEKMDYTIQKAVELGVKKIIPLLTERCNVRLDPERQKKRFNHWQQIVISACEQSGRNQLPILLEPMPLNEAAWGLLKADQCFILSPQAKQTRINLLPRSTQSVTLIVGSEGGFSEKELHQAHIHGCEALNLGPRILRTETAAIAAITVLQCQFGDMVI